MNYFLIAISSYLLIGIIALGIFESVTKRISRKLDWATSETQSNMVSAGCFFNYKIARLIILVITWIFWPVIFFGAITKEKEDINGESK